MKAKKTHAITCNMNDLFGYSVLNRTVVCRQKGLYLVTDRIVQVRGGGH